MFNAMNISVAQTIGEFSEHWTRTYDQKVVSPQSCRIPKLKEKSAFSGAFSSGDRTRYTIFGADTYSIVYCICQMIIV